VLIWHNR